MESIRVLAIIFIVVFAIALYAFLNSNSLPNAATTTVIAQQGQGAPANALYLDKVIDSGVSNISQESFGVNYTGYVTIGQPSVTNSSNRFPVSITYVRYFNASRLAISADNAILFSNLSIVYVRTNGSRFYCTAETLEYIAGFPVQGPSGYACSAINSSAENSIIGSTSELYSQFGLQNASTIEDIPLTGNGTRTFNGMPCLFLSGNTTANNQFDLFGSGTQRYEMATCISYQYHIPLNLTLIQGTPNDSAVYQDFEINLSVSSINYTVNGTGIGKLPGQLTNSTSGISTPSFNSLIINVSNVKVNNSCIATPYYECSNITNSGSAISFDFGQNMGNTIYNTELACAAGNYNGNYSFVRSFNGSLSPMFMKYVGNLQCTGFTNSTAGNWLVGAIVLNYTDANEPASSSNPWLQGIAAAFIVNRD